ncbi:ABC transporter substrate-binding protein [Candidatus Poriferisodalis sp.]|uniref:ABC transporter substrate-binding protein n=1 Tax=Candidatus Poriferisodalis sp. TaxID=3101277 RepID=UPI003AF9D174
MKIRTYLCVAVAAVLLAAGCTSGTDDADVADTAGTTDTATPTDEAAATEASAAPSDASGVEFVYANPYGFGDLDPSSAFSNENTILQNLYETLTQLADPEASDEVSGVLAESWSSNADATEWSFKIRESVTFHDGTPLTAGAVRDSLQRTIDLGLGAAFILSSVESMEVPDDHTLTFKLAWPTPLDLVMSSQYSVYVVCPSAVGNDAAWFNEGNACGTGPYTIDSHDPAGSTWLARFDDYWGGWSEDQVETVEMRLIEDPVLAEQLIRNGDAHFTYNLPFDVYTSLEQDSDIDVLRSLSMTNLFGMLNVRRLSPEIREALVLSFPYDDVTASLYGGEAVRARGMVPLTVWGSSPDLDIPATDLDRARQLIEAAGADGLTVTYSFDAGTTEQQQIGEVWKANLSTIGVNLELEPLTWDARWEKAKSDPDAAQDVFTMFWFPTYVTPYDFLFSTFHSEEAPFFNLGYYSNETFDALIDEADAISGTDREAASELFRQAQEILIDDHAAVFMLDVPSVEVLRAEFTGHIPNPAYNTVVRFYELRAVR